MSFLKNLFKGRRWIIGIAALVVVPSLATIVLSYSSSKRVVSTHTKKPALATPTDQVNLIDDTQFFVQQQYRDFLNREPDAPGLAFWTNEITSCGSNVQCAEVKRINVSAAFFLSIEFQNTGYLVYRTYKAAFGTIPNKPVPVTRELMLPDMREIGNGVIVNQGNWEQQLEFNKQAYFNEFITREQFLTLYPPTMSPEQFVDMLNANAGRVLSQTERDSLVNDLKTNAKSRAQVLRVVAEDTDLAKAEFNKAFVLMQYFGYLRRNPDSTPDRDFSGFNFWLGKLNEFGGNYIQAEMVKAFLNSIEYIQRFNLTTLTEPTFTATYPDKLYKLSDDTSGVVLASSSTPVSFGGAQPEDGSAYADSGYAISVSAVDYPKPFSVTQYFTDELGDVDVKTPISLTVGGVQAYQTGLNEIGSEARIILVPYNGKVYDIEYRSTFDDSSPEGIDGLNVFRNFLQSFHFTQ